MLTVTKVLVVDDSLFIRELFVKLLSEDPEIEVVGSAADPLEARDLIKQLNPDVLTLDIEMPKMDGITFLEKIMSLRPMPVVMVSTLTEKGADVTMRALELGAIDYIAKPKSMSELETIKDELISKVKTAAKAKVGARTKATATSAAGTSAKILSYTGDPKKWLIAIGSSTGGVEAVRDVINLLPENAPGVVITQHMPPMFTESFAKRMSTICKIKVHEAKDNQVIEPGNAYIAPGGLHMKVAQKGMDFVCRVYDGERVSSHKPSVDVLFHSISQVCPTRTVAAILTGMGQDGAKGMLALRQAGAKTIGQNEASCVVYGMPRAAMQLGGVEQEYSLKDIAAEILKRCHK